MLYNIYKKRITRGAVTNSKNHYKLLHSYPSGTVGITLNLHTPNPDILVRPDYDREIHLGLYKDPDGTFRIGTAYGSAEHNAIRDIYRFDSFLLEDKDLEEPDDFDSRGGRRTCFPDMITLSENQKAWFNEVYGIEIS